jgi:deoxyribonuclease V
MRLHHEHPWRVTPTEGIAIQRQLVRHVRCQSSLGQVSKVAGVDVSTKGGVGRAAVVVLSYPELRPLKAAIAERELEMPYVPGLLSFREAPAILEALERLGELPDLLVFDGQGYAHPRRMGIATHLGVLLDHPTIGCAKSRLCGRHDEPGPNKGDWAPIRDGGEVVGAAVRSRVGVKPIYVSMGHRVDLGASIDMVLACCTRFKLPETTRWAHRVAGGADLP